MTKKKTSRKSVEFDRSSPAHARAHHGPRLARILSLALVAVLGFGGSVAFAIQWRVNSSLTQIDTKKYVSTPQIPKDPRAGESLNILIMGTDSRAGAGADLVGDHVGGERSDTTMIVHVSSDRSRVEVVSIPRDSMVYLPACQVGDGKTVPAQQRGMFNNAFARGWDYGGDYVFAAACTVETVQWNTGLIIDHTVIINFAGFVGMVDALGGIDINIPEDVTSKKAGNLKLSAGEQTLDGKTALQVVRARTGSGWGLDIGSDLKRIERQQAVLEATVQTALSKNMLTDINKLTGFVTASLESLTVDNDLGADDIIALAWSLKSIKQNNVKFYSTPVGTDPTNKNRVVWLETANEYWERLKVDDPIEDEPSNETADCEPADDAEEGTEPNECVSTEPSESTTP